MSLARAGTVHEPAPRSNAWGRTAWLLAFGGIGLATGVLVYLTDRAGSLALFGTIGGWWPSLVHPFAFSLFCAAVLPARATPGYAACVAWAALNLAFEIGQHPQLSPSLAALVLGAFGQTLPGRSLAGFFLRGTFDPADLLATVAGSVAAAGVIHLLDRQWET